MPTVNTPATLPESLERANERAAAKLNPEARILKAIADKPAWLPTGRGEVGIVNRMLDDGRLTGTFSGRGQLTSLKATGAMVEAQVIADNFLHAKPVPGAVGAFLRAVRDEYVTIAHIVAAVASIQK